MDRVEKGLLGLIAWVILTLPVSFVGGVVIGVNYNFGWATLFSCGSMILGVAAGLIWFHLYLNNDPRLRK